MARLPARARHRLRGIAAAVSGPSGAAAGEALDLFGREIPARPDETPVPPLEGAALADFHRLRDEPLEMPPPPEGVANMAAQLDADGFLHLPGCLNPELRQELLELSYWTMKNPRNDEYYKDGQPAAEILAALAPGEDPTVENAPPGTGWHVKNAWNRRPEYLKYADMDPTCAICEILLGADCHLIGMTSWITGPGRTDQGLHNDYLPFEVPSEKLRTGQVKMPVFLITAHYYLDDMFEELGPTKFIKGSHVAGRRPAGGENHFEGMPAQSLHVKAGDCVMFRSDVWHRGSRNLSNSTRHILQVRALSPPRPPLYCVQTLPVPCTCLPVLVLSDTMVHAPLSVSLSPRCTTASATRTRGSRRISTVAQTLSSSTYSVEYPRLQKNCVE
jgi:hypothetical protein